jgi:hypothetical protein
MEYRLNWVAHWGLADRVVPAGVNMLALSDLATDILAETGVTPSSEVLPVEINASHYDQVTTAQAYLELAMKHVPELIPILEKAVQANRVTHIHKPEGFIASENTALLAIDSGESGYIHIKLGDRVRTLPRLHRIVHWRILDSDMDIIHSDSDMAVTLNTDVTEAMRSFLSFLLAFAEAKSPESDNWDLFADSLRDWAQYNSTELEALHFELSDDKDNQSIEIESL